MNIQKIYLIKLAYFLVTFSVIVCSISMADDRFKFSTDWTSAYVETWKRELAPVAGKKGVTYLEIGVWEGRTLIWMFENILTDQTSRATAIDIKIVQPLKDNLQIAKVSKRTKLIESTSFEALKNLKTESFDIIYLDACHLAKNVLTDTVLAWPLLKPGGILILDDYKFFNNGKLPIGLRPKNSIDAFLIAHQDDLKVLHSGYQIIVKKNQKPISSLCPERCNQCSRFFNYVYSWNIFKEVYDEGCIKKGLYKEIPGTSKLEPIAISDEEETSIKSALLFNRAMWSESDKEFVLNQFPNLKNILNNR